MDDDGGYINNDLGRREEKTKEQKLEKAQGTAETGA